MDFFESPPQTPVRETLDESSLTLQLGKSFQKNEDRIPPVGLSRTRMNAVDVKGYLEVATPFSLEAPVNEAEVEMQHDRAPWVSSASSMAVPSEPCSLSLAVGDNEAKAAGMGAAADDDDDDDDDDGDDDDEDDDDDYDDDGRAPKEADKAENGGMESGFSHLFGDSDYNPISERDYWFEQEIADGEGLSEEDVIEIAGIGGENSAEGIKREFIVYGHQFCAGDIVWGQVRTNQWWPGQLYSSSDASEFGEKFKRKDCILVAYFGNDSFSWCHPSQLEPFEENFELRSRQSRVKNFAKAVREALNLVSRLVELRLTCPCIGECEAADTIPPPVKNSGLKADASVHVSAIDGAITIHYDPPAFMEYLWVMARASAPETSLDLAVIRSWLAVFYRAKGVPALETYREPVPILETESPSFDRDRKEEDYWVSHSSSSRRKKKMKKAAPEKEKEKEEEPEEEREEHEEHEEEQEEEDEDERSGLFEEEERRPSLKKRARARAKLKVRKRTHVQSNEKLTAATATGSSPQNGDARRKKGGSRSRERKKSKYLSPPYTAEGDGSKAVPPGVSKLGERMSKVAGQLVGYPRIRRCQIEASGFRSGDRECVAEEERAFEETVDPKWVLSELCDLAAGNYSGIDSSFQPIKRFLFVFKCSVSRDEKREEETERDYPEEVDVDAVVAAVAVAPFVVFPDDDVVAVEEEVAVGAAMVREKLELMTAIVNQCGDARLPVHVLQMLAVEMRSLLDKFPSA